MEGVEFYEVSVGNMECNKFEWYEILKLKRVCIGY